MLPKTLFLVVLCFAAVFANSKPGPQRSVEVQRAAYVRVAVTFKRFDVKVRGLLEKVANAWTRFWDRALGLEGRRKDKEIRALKAELARIQKQSSDELDAVKAKYQKILAAKEEEIDELQGDREQLIRAKRQLAAIQKDAANAINDVINNWDNQIDDLDNKIERTLQE